MTIYKQMKSLGFIRVANIALAAVVLLGLASLAQTNWVFAQVETISFCHVPPGNQGNVQIFLDQPITSWTKAHSSGTGQHADDFEIENDDDLALCQSLIDDDPETGSITITKAVQGAGEQEVPAEWSFGFSGEWSFSIAQDTDGSQHIEDDLDADDYIVTEDTLLPEDWYFIGIECNEGASVVIDGQSVTISLDEGEDVECTFTNEYRSPEINTSTVTICKEDGSETPLPGWEVFIENGQQTQYGGTTGDNGCVEVSDVPFGEYTLGEDLQQGWVNVSGDGDSVVVDEETETFTLVNREGELVDYCDPSQKPNGMSIGEWLAQNDVDGSECFDYEVVQQCGSLDVQFTQNDTPYDYEFRYVLGNQTPALVDWEGDGVLPVNFSEDENGGSVEVTYYVVGPESDYFTGFGIPNIWDGNGETVVVDTDCEGSEGGEQCELVDLTIFSDEDTQVNGVDSVATFTHPAWTASIPGATWIWESFFVDNSTLPQTLTFSRSFNWTGDTNVAGNLDIATDNGYVVRINGTEVVDASGDSHFTLADQDAIDVSSFLLDGANTLEIDVINFEGPEDPEANPAGLLYGLDIEGENCETPEQETGDDDDSGDDDDDDSSTSGGGGSSSRRSSGDDDDDGEVLGATAGEVLQAQTAVLPAGAPATGFGGMSGMAGEGASALGGILSLFGGLALFAGKTKVGGE